eukprot:2948845-Amphidinium_carterae.1
MGNPQTRNGGNKKRATRMQVQRVALDCGQRVFVKCSLETSAIDFIALVSCSMAVTDNLATSRSRWHDALKWQYVLHIRVERVRELLSLWQQLMFFLCATSRKVFGSEEAAVQHNQSLLRNIQTRLDSVQWDINRKQPLTSTRRNH